MEQYPPHALPPPCCWSLRWSFCPWFSLSHSPGVWRIFSTSSSKAHWTPSLVFALASVQRKVGKKQSTLPNVTNEMYTSAKHVYFYKKLKLMTEIYINKSIFFKKQIKHIEHKMTSFKKQETSRRMQTSLQRIESATSPCPILFKAPYFSRFKMETPQKC